jgi:toxin FitB
VILLDTNVISEVMRPMPEPTVSAWLNSQLKEDLWTASVVVAELFAGIEALSAGRKERELREAVEGMIAEDFRRQILYIDLAAARNYGQILALRNSIGRPIREMDALIAATAFANGATLATRNTSHFENCGIQLVNPWEAA